MKIKFDLNLSSLCRDEVLELLSEKAIQEWNNVYAEDEPNVGTLSLSLDFKAWEVVVTPDDNSEYTEEFTIGDNLSDFI